MTQQHPITPPPELVQQWLSEIWHEGTPVRVAASDLHIGTQAAQWGADQELEACCQWISDDAEALRIVRRPKLPSLKDQALEDLEILVADLANHGMGFKATNIRRALEQLPD